MFNFQKSSSRRCLGAFFELFGFHWYQSVVTISRKFHIGGLRLRGSKPTSVNDWRDIHLHNSAKIQVKQASFIQLLSEDSDSDCGGRLWLRVRHPDSNINPNKIFFNANWTVFSEQACQQSLMVVF